MKNTRTDNITIPAVANFVQHGAGTPVILIHGIAASLHDWDDLIPELTQHGYAAYALDLLGHGESPKPDFHAYHVNWMFEHFEQWMRSLRLTEPAIVIGHSLGGYLALEYARRLSTWTRGLILVNPFYSRLQLLNPLLRRSYSNRNLRGYLASKAPIWVYRAFVEIGSFVMGRNNSAIHSLPERIRIQTTLDFVRTAPGVYHIPSNISDMTDVLPQINIPTLVVWGDRDQTLSPTSFSNMVSMMPRATGKSVRAGHVPHQSKTQEFNELVMEFLRELK
jgi:pimeloyl-ACP methyl ester carboxylesterase